MAGLTLAAVCPAIAAPGPLPAVTHAVAIELVLALVLGLIIGYLLAYRPRQHSGTEPEGLTRVSTDLPASPPSPSAPTPGTLL